MALKKKGSRKIVINDMAYRWQTRDNGDNLTLAIESFEEPHQTLTVCFWWDKLPSQFSVTPKSVSFIIKHALKQGWTPSQKGNEFSIQPTPEMIKMLTFKQERN